MTKVRTLALVDDDAAILDSLGLFFTRRGIVTSIYPDAEAMLATLQEGADFDCVVADVRMPGLSGLELLKAIVARPAAPPVVLITGHGDIAMAVQAMQQGTYDFIAKPFASDHLASVVRRAADKRRLALQVRALRRQLEQRQGIEAMLLGRSAAMERRSVSVT